MYIYIYIRTHTVIHLHIWECFCVSICSFVDSTTGWGHIRVWEQGHWEVALGTCWFHFLTMIGFNLRICWWLGNKWGWPLDFKFVNCGSPGPWFNFIFQGSTPTPWQQTAVFPESACEGFFVKKQPLYYIFTHSHLLIYIFTHSYLLIYIFTPSHLQI